jgi:hypothetical protein
VRRIAGAGGRREEGKGDMASNTVRRLDSRFLFAGWVFSSIFVALFPRVKVGGIQPHIPKRSPMVRSDINPFMLDVIESI